MRLLNVHTWKQQWFSKGNLPRYAILSHTWSAAGEELSLQDLEAGLLESDDAELPSKSGVIKVRSFCDLARRNGYQWVWVDTCNIDQSSSTELSEAINSMYRWYNAAEICFVHLSDVFDDDNPLERSAQLRKSRWFSRGWTLQELIAPDEVRFYSATWTYLGSRSSFSDIIENVTSIPTDLFSDKTLDSFSIAQRMSWASQRSTTREEDLAYCLLGIFDVNMPLLYGEGNRAFQRLQEEIIMRSRDHSIFAWGFVAEHDEQTPFRQSLAAFKEKAETLQWQRTALKNKLRRIAKDVMVPGDTTLVENKDASRRWEQAFTLEELLTIEKRTASLEDGKRVSVLATEPADFRGCHEIISCEAWKPQKLVDFELTKTGVYIELPVGKVRLPWTGEPQSVALLNCCLTTCFANVIALPVIIGKLSKGRIRLSRLKGCTPVLCSRARLPYMQLRIAYMQALNLDRTEATQSGNSEDVVHVQASGDLSLKIISHAASARVTPKKTHLLFIGPRSPETKSAIFLGQSTLSSELFGLKVEVVSESFWSTYARGMLSPSAEPPSRRVVRCWLANALKSSSEYTSKNIGALDWKKSIKFEQSSISAIVEKGAEIGIKRNIVKIERTGDKSSCQHKAFQLAYDPKLDIPLFLNVTLSIIYAWDATAYFYDSRYSAAVVNTLAANLQVMHLLSRLDTYKKSYSVPMVSYSIFFGAVLAFSVPQLSQKIVMHNTLPIIFHKEASQMISELSKCSVALLFLGGVNRFNNSAVIVGTFLVSIFFVGYLSRHDGYIAVIVILGTVFVVRSVKVLQ